MSAQEIIKAVAELDGWKCLYHGKTGKDLKFKHGDGRYVRSWKDLPCYLTSRDAIIGVIEKQPFETKLQVMEHLEVIIGPDSIHGGDYLVCMVCATPRQLCEALLRACMS